MLMELSLTERVFMTITLHLHVASGHIRMLKLSPCWCWCWDAGCSRFCAGAAWKREGRLYGKPFVSKLHSIQWSNRRLTYRLINWCRISYSLNWRCSRPKFSVWRQINISANASSVWRQYDVIDRNFFIAPMYDDTEYDVNCMLMNVWHQCMTTLG